MAKKDKIHDQVKNALIKDGWTITHDPYTIEYEEVTLYADLGAERPFAAERDGQKIVVEVKSFIHPSPMSALEKAVGQYNIYFGLLREIDPERKLHLAVSEDIYHKLFEQKAIQLIIQLYQIKIIIVDIHREEIVAWKN